MLCERVVHPREPPVATDHRAGEGDALQRLAHIDRRWVRRHALAAVAERAIAAGLHVEATLERGSFRSELTSPATRAADDGLGIGRLFVHVPAMTDHRTQDNADSHGPDCTPARKRHRRSGFEGDGQPVPSAGPLITWRCLRGERGWVSRRTRVYGVRPLSVTAHQVA